MIQNLRAVFSDFLCISGSYVYNLFKSSKELAYYLCTDKINDLILLNADEEASITPVLACNDRVLRILDVNIFNQKKINNARLQSNREF
jgi:hypothetical protein